MCNYLREFLQSNSKYSYSCTVKGGKFCRVSGTDKDRICTDCTDKDIGDE